MMHHRFASCRSLVFVLLAAAAACSVVACSGDDDDSLAPPLNNGDSGSDVKNDTTGMVMKDSGKDGTMTGDDGAQGDDATADDSGNDATGDDATGDDGGTTDSGTDASDSGTSDASDSSTSDASDSGSGGDASDSGSGGDASDSGSGDDAGDAGQMFNLTIHNYLGWCGVNIDDGGVNQAAIIDAGSFAPGTVLNLFADTDNATLFRWGYWQGLDAADASAENTNMSVQVTIDNNRLVRACCPDILPADGGCPAGF